MEPVLAVDKRPGDPDDPVVCLDEPRVPWVKEGRPVVPARPGRIERYDVEYERHGVAHLIPFDAPFIGWCRIDVADHHAARQWAQSVRILVENDFAQAKRITLVMDHLNTHTGASLDQAFEPAVSPDTARQREIRLHAQTGELAQSGGMRIQCLVETMLPSAYS